MLEKGDVKVVGHAHNKQFRRRFIVPFYMFNDIVEQARDWIGLNGIKLGVLGVPVELKILGALRMFAKGCSYRTPTQSVIRSPNLMPFNLLPVP